MQYCNLTIGLVGLNIVNGCQYGLRVIIDSSCNFLRLISLRQSLIHLYPNHNQSHFGQPAGSHRDTANTNQWFGAYRCQMPSRGPCQSPQHPLATVFTSSQEGQIQSRWPNRMAWKSFLHSSSQTRSFE